MSEEEEETDQRLLFLLPDRWRRKRRKAANVRIPTVLVLSLGADKCFS